MAQAFPNSEFIGYDFHDASISRARRHASGLDNVSFGIARAQDFEGSGFDLLMIFDTFHDMADPAHAARHARNSLKSNGTLMLVEPMAGDTLSENLNPVSRVYFAFSTSVCVPGSLGQEVGAALRQARNTSRWLQLGKALGRRVSVPCGIKPTTGFSG